MEEKLEEALIKLELLNIVFLNDYVSIPKPKRFYFVTAARWLCPNHFVSGIAYASLYAIVT